MLFDLGFGIEECCGGIKEKRESHGVSMAWSSLNSAGFSLVSLFGTGIKRQPRFLIYFSKYKFCAHPTEGYFIYNGTVVVLYPCPFGTGLYVFLHIIIQIVGFCFFKKGLCFSGTITECFPDYLIFFHFNAFFPVSFHRKFLRISYETKILRGDAQKRIWKIVTSWHAFRAKVYKSLMSEGYRELKWTCPLCSVLGKFDETDLSIFFIACEMSWNYRK